MFLREKLCACALLSLHIEEFAASRSGLDIVPTRQKINLPCIFGEAVSSLCGV